MTRVEVEALQKTFGDCACTCCADAHERHRCNEMHAASRTGNEFLDAARQRSLLGACNCCEREPVEQCSCPFCQACLRELGTVRKAAARLKP